MEIQTAFRGHYADKTVLVTGHTGFKGVWLASWLRMLGATVVGFSLEPDESQRRHFEGSRIAEGMVSIEGDVRDLGALSRVFEEHPPDIVFHLAAQSLVGRSYQDPLDTMTTNIVGTLHVLEVARKAPSVGGVVVVTTDKVYENKEWPHAYREVDPLGGHDPYSASKAAAEVVTASYRQSFPSDRAGIATARAGNVIGGGDFSPNRLLPDCARSLVAGQPIQVRNPSSIRPWQHVLEPLSAYLWLGVRLVEDRSTFGGGWNFGPNPEGHISVAELVVLTINAWGDGEWVDVSDSSSPHEAETLILDCSKANRSLEWRPIWSVQRAVAKTVEWYRAAGDRAKFDSKSLIESQIQEYLASARSAGLEWAR